MTFVGEVEAFVEQIQSSYHKQLPKLTNAANLALWRRWDKEADSLHDFVHTSGVFEAEEENWPMNHTESQRVLH